MKTDFPPSDTASPALLSISKGNTLEDVDETRLPYTWLSNLGSGACGIVEEVEDINTGAVYARKLLRLKSWNKRSMKELFENEIEIIKSLGEHHHLIQVFATYTTKDKLGLILTPFAEDGDLHEFLAKFQELNSSDTSESTTKENMRLTLTRGFGCLAGGLSYMHERRIRHKDIKAQNILIHQGKVIYTDFGLSFDSNLLENSTTDDLASMTRRYAAPEVIQNRPRNSSSDVFALGCVFLEIYSALTAGVQFLQQGEYSEAMPKIHTLLLSTYSPIELHPIFEFIVSMTSDIPEARPSAKLIGSSLLRRLEFCCPQCYSECTIAGADESQSQSLPPASSPTSTISSLSRIDDTGRIDDTQRIEDTQRMYKPTNTPSYASPARMSFRARVLSKLAVRSPPQSTNDPLGLIVIHQPNSPPALDIIFVHGMGGTSRATWSKDRDPEYFWPGKWLPFEPEMASARILSFGYNATFAASGPAVVTGIADVAGDLLFEMQFAKRRLDLGKVYYIS
jgi:serine/threonine protein kinase